MMKKQWSIEKQTGFLFPAPLPSFLEADCGLEAELLATLEEARRQLHAFLQSPDPQQSLSVLSDIDYRTIIEGCVAEDCLEACFILYGYLASAWLHGLGRKLLPHWLAVPLVALAEKVDRPPILSYAGQVLGNWRLLDEQAGFILQNIALIYRFTDLPDESWFFRVHVAIEAQAADMLMAMLEAQAALEMEKDAAVLECLRRMRSGLVEITRTFHAMPEYCDPDIYFQQVRIFLMSFNAEVIFEGVAHNPTPLRGGSGAQSSIVPAMLVGLGIAHEDNILTTNLNDMRRYMPRAHRQFIARMRQSRLRSYCKARPPLRDAYNHVLRQLINFRRAHLYFARTYIFEKSTNQLGSGGTSYLSFLSKLIDETVDQML